MYLPVRLAASLPTSIVFLGALIFGLSQASGRALHPVYGLPNAGFMAFFMTIPTLLLVLPNIAGAMIANRYGDANMFTFSGSFAAVVLLVSFVQARILNNFIRASLFDFADWRIWAALGLNILVLLIAAAWRGRALHD